MTGFACCRNGAVTRCSAPCCERGEYVRAWCGAAVLRAPCWCYRPVVWCGQLPWWWSSAPSRLIVCAPCLLPLPNADAHAGLAFGHATPSVTGLWAQTELDLTHNATLSDASATVNGAAAQRTYLQGNRAVFTARATDFTFSGAPEVLVTTTVGTDSPTSYRLSLPLSNSTTFGTSCAHLPSRRGPRVPPACIHAAVGPCFHACVLHTLCPRVASLSVWWRYRPLLRRGLRSERRAAVPYVPHLLAGSVRRRHRSP